MEERKVPGSPAEAGGGDWEVTFVQSPEAGGRAASPESGRRRSARRARGRRSDRARRQLRQRPRQQRVAQEARLFDYEGEEKGGVYASLVPVVAGYIIPGIIVVALVFGLLFGLGFTGALGGSGGWLDDAISAADAGGGNLYDFESIMDSVDIVELMPTMAILLLVMFAIAIPFLLLFTRQVERRKFRTLGLDGRRMGGKFLLGLAAGALACLIPFFASAVILRSPLSLNPNAGFRWDWVLPQLLALGFVCIQGSFEELFFRGWAFTTLGKRFGRVRAVLVSSVVFGLMHFAFTAESLLSILNAFSIGILFCVMSMSLGDIALPCGFHAMWNYLQFTLLTGVTRQGGWFVAGLDMEDDSRYLYITIAWTVLMGAMAALFYWRKVRAERRAWTGAENAGLESEALERETLENEALRAEALGSADVESVMPEETGIWTIDEENRTS